jgi:hypothetical protein
VNEEELVAEDASTEETSTEDTQVEDCLAPMDLDDAPVEVDVTIGGRPYVLQEASGDAACKYRNALMNCTKLGPNGKAQSMHNAADVEPLLISMCLFRVNPEKPDGQHPPVPLKIIRSWPNRIQKGLFNRIKAISDGLLEGDSDAEDKAKNEPSETMDGFD